MRPFQIILGNREGTGIPFVHRHPADGLFYPLVQAELAESILLTRVLLGGFTGSFDLIDAHRDAEGGLLTQLGICPILILSSAVNDGIESGINLSPLRNVDGFLVYLIADGVGIVARCCDQEIQRLHPGITRP